MRRRLGRLAALTRKETIQIVRDRRTLSIILLLPLVELFLFAYAIRLTVEHLPTVVADLSRDDQSRALLAALVESRLLRHPGHVDGPGRRRAGDGRRPRQGGHRDPAGLRRACGTRRRAGAGAAGRLRLFLGQLRVQRGGLPWRRRAPWSWRREQGRSRMGVELQTHAHHHLDPGALQSRPERPGLHHAGAGGAAPADAWRC